MRSNVQIRMAVLAVVSATGMFAQDAPLSSGSVSISLANVPVTLVSEDIGQSRVSARGAATVVDLHMAMVLRNAGASRIRGVTLRVMSQEATMGGKGSVTITGMNVGPGENFPVRIDTQTWRPTQVTGGPLVQVDVDGVLFHDLSFVGPDRLHSRRYLTACELEAQRDREYLKRVLAQGNKEGLRQEILRTQSRLAEAASLNVKVVRRGPSVASSALPQEHSAQFAMLQFPDDPVVPIEGTAQVGGNEASMARIEVRNKSGKAVRYVELGWILTDQAGRRSMAASLPSSEPDLFLPAGKTARLVQDTALALYSRNQPVNVDKMTGFINQVEFADGKVWVPNRQNLQNLAPSAEEQRLSAIYSTKGIDALIEELKKF